MGAFMKRIMRKLCVGIYVFLLCINSIMIKVEAIENETTIELEVGLEIDESVDELTGIFDEVGRFNRFGITKIGKRVELNNQTTQYKYGLMNLNGEIVLEPKYDWINDYNEELFSVGSYINIDQNIFTAEGLVSKETGAIVLEPKYTWLPSLENIKMAQLSFIETIETDEGNSYSWKNELLSYKDGLFSKPTLPTTNDNSEFDFVFPTKYEEFTILQGSSYDCENYSCNVESLSWFIDEYGNELFDFTFDYVNGIVKVSESEYYFSYSNVIDRSQHIYSSGLLKITKVGEKYEYVETITLEQGYNNLWIDVEKMHVKYNKLVGENNTWGFYDLGTKTFVDETRSGYNFKDTVIIPGFTDLDVSRNCGINENNVWICSFKFVKEDGSQITTDADYESFAILDSNHVLLYDWTQNGTYTNILYRDSLGNARLVYSNAKFGYLNYVNTGYVYLTSWENGLNYLTLTSLHKDNPIDLYNNVKGAWFQSFAEYSLVKTVTYNNGVYSEVNDVFENQSGNVLLNDVYNLNISYDNNLQLYKGFYASQNNSQNYPFIIKNGIETRVDKLVDQFRDYDEYGYAKIVRFESYKCGAENCAREKVSIVNANLQLLIQDADQVDYIDNGNAIIAKRNVLDDSNSIISTKYDYVYLNNFNNLIQTPLTYANNKLVTFNEESLLVSVVNADGKRQYYRAGSPLTALNNSLIISEEANDIFKGVILYKKLNQDTNQLETYVSNESGDSIIMENVDSFAGRIIKQNDIYSYVSLKQINGINSIVLTSIDSTISNNFAELNNVSNQIYSHNYPQGGKVIFTLIANESGENFELDFDYIILNNEIAKFCSISNDPIQSRYYQVFAYNDVSCTSTNKGLLNYSGTMILEPSFNSFEVNQDFIIASRFYGSNLKYSLFNLDGLNVLENENFEDTYFDQLDLSNLPYVTAFEDGKSHLFYVTNSTPAYLGNISIQQIENSEFFIYTQPNLDGSFNKGVLDSFGNMIINASHDYDYFYVIKDEQMIATARNIEGNSEALGLFDFYGNQLLTDEYGAIVNYDDISESYKFVYDNRGYLELNYLNPNLFVSMYQTQGNDGSIIDGYWQDMNASFRVRNFYNPSKKEIIYENPSFSEEIVTGDGFVNVRQLVQTNGSIDDTIARKVEYYYELSGNEKKLVEETISVINGSNQVVVEAGKYTSLAWDANRNLVITQKCVYERLNYNSIMPKCKMGLIDKEGTVIVEPIYDSISYDEELTLYRTTNNMEDGAQETGLISESGELLVSGVYGGGIYYNKEFNWLLLISRKKLITDPKTGLSGNTYVTDIIDIASKKQIFTDLLYFTNDNLNRLKEKGFSEVSITQDTGYIYQGFGRDPNTGTIVPYTYVYPNTKSGILDETGTYLLDPLYDEFQQIYLEQNSNFDPLVELSGYYIVGNKGAAKTCSEAILNEDTGIYYESSYTCYNPIVGVFDVERGMIIEPEYSEIYRINSEGYAVVRSQSEIVERFDDYYSLTLKMKQSESGLINVFEGKEIIKPKYEEIKNASATYKINSNKVPTFDQNGLIKVKYEEFIEIEGELASYLFVGLANKIGVFLENNYLNAYYKNGYYYARDVEGNWHVFDSNLENEVVLEVESLGMEFGSIEILSNKKILVEQKVIGELESYSVYGVLNEDLSIYLPFEFNSISFDGLLWYLEKYNPILGSYPRAIMDNDGNYVMPFSDKYDSLSEFVGGYAIGQSGEKDVPESTGALNIQPLLSLFFTEVNADDNEFVLEVIDENGFVVGDLSDMYESATLLGESNGVVRALVQKDGKYFIANLVETKVEVVKITGVELSNDNVSLNIGESYQITGKILPDNQSQRKKVYWSSNDESIVVIDQNGLIKAIKEGTTTIQYSVNEFSASATINVNKPIVVPPITPPTNEIKQAVESFIEIITLETKDIVTEKELFVQQYQNLKQKDPDFMQYLSIEELKLYENKIKTYFDDLINIEFTDDSIPVNLTGLYLNLDIDKLIRGETIKYIVKVIQREDLALFDSFIQNQQYNTEIYHIFDISIIDEFGNEINEFAYPVQFTLTLPEPLRGQGELVLLHNHNGEIVNLPLIMNIDYTFTFETNRLSEFLLIRNMRNILIEPDNNKIDSGISNGLIYFGVVGIVLILVLIWYLLKKRITSV